MKRRYDPAVTALFADPEAARTEQSRADTAKRGARARLDARMETTLKTYRNTINDPLVKFGARFRIEGFGANFRGTAPGTEYASKDCAAQRGTLISTDGDFARFPGLTWVNPLVKNSN